MTEIELPGYDYDFCEKLFLESLSKKDSEFGCVFVPVTGVSKMICTDWITAADFLESFLIKHENDAVHTEIELTGVGMKVNVDVLIIRRSLCETEAAQ
ncbi:hypothetical protein [Methanolapillus millepedarum]|uniref:Uncharacterized protein n=1 Tax=Methanolapillus millepedarum TaxID=3028296 RepID=A0AA96V3Y4_9EURY|nr:hypothetical protein MsAc7_17270 [Methanosarcinaceae archaeon Ac7]